MYTRLPAITNLIFCTVSKQNSWRHVGIGFITNRIKVHFLIMLFDKMSFAEAVVQRYSVEKVLLEISKNSQKITCARVSFLIKWQTPGLQLY